MHSLYLKSPLSALSLTILFNLLGLVFQPLIIFAGAGIALHVLLGNFRLALSLLACSFFTLWLAIYFVFSQSEESFHYDSYLVIIGFYAPLTLSAITLSKTYSQALATFINALVSMIWVSIIGFSELGKGYLKELESLLLALSQQNAEIKPEDIDGIISFIIPSIGATIFVLLTGSLFIARLWQSKAFKPGGFSEEFRTFQLGKKLSFVLIGIVGLGIANITIAKEMMAIALLLLALQGLSLLHFFAYKKQLNRNLIFIFYLLFCFVFPLFFTPVFIAILLLFAISSGVDSWVNFRTVYEKRTTNSH